MPLLKWISFFSIYNKPLYFISEILYSKQVNNFYHMH